MTHTQPYFDLLNVHNFVFVGFVAPNCKHATWRTTGHRLHAP